MLHLISTSSKSILPDLTRTPSIHEGGQAPGRPERTSSRPRKSRGRPHPSFSSIGQVNQLLDSSSIPVIRRGLHPQGWLFWQIPPQFVNVVWSSQSPPHSGSRIESAARQDKEGGEVERLGHHEAPQTQTQACALWRSFCPLSRSRDTSFSSSSSCFQRYRHGTAFRC